MIRVNLGVRSYPIVVGDLGPEALTGQIVRHTPVGSTVFVGIDAQVAALWGKELRRSWRRSSRRIVEFAVPPGERAKSASNLAGLYSFFLDNRITRGDFILAIGGGVTTDLVGYAAATILRGVAWGAVPTTLVGMVDASIGGKTGINHPSGKNLVGAFWQPSFVLLAPAFLATLSAREYRAGMGEVAKYAGLAGGSFLRDFQRSLSSGLPDADRVRRIIARSAKYKANIVSRDEREGRLRRILNLGHTVGHGIEKSLGFGRLLHGEAVLLGLDAAIELSVAQKPARRNRLNAFQGMVRHLIHDLPRRRLDAGSILKAMRLDKKREGQAISFVLLDAPGRPILSTEVSPAEVALAVETMIEHYES